MSLISFELLSNICLLALTIAILFYLSSIRQLPLPPSPKSDPIIGHLRSLSTANHLFYAEISEALKSDIISFTALGQVIIVLSSPKAAHELFEQRSAIYSDRPECPMLTYPDLLGWGRNTGFLRYGERWKNQRRMTHAMTNKKASAELWPQIVKQSRLAMKRLLTNPNNFVEDITRMTGATLLSAIYGYEVTLAHDPLLEVIEAAMSHMSEAAITNNFYVNTIPWLRFVPEWFPGTAWKRKAKEWRIDTLGMINNPFDWTKEQIAQETAVPSVLKTMLRELESRGEERYSLSDETDMIKWTLGTLLGAGADTSASSIQVFILAMTLYPEVQARARAEIDAVIGTDRLPDMEDRESLPYIECVMKEVFRWQSVAPLGNPHACTKDDEYAGYRIPKGAIVFSNIWAMSYDSSVYVNPQIFNPDRFLDPSLPSAPAFGFGRRICPGVHMAESTLFMAVCSLLAVFNISAVRDSQGNAIPPSVNMKTNALLSCPARFECSIQPRSPKAVELLNTLG